MSMIAAWRQWSPVVSKMKPGFRLRECVNVKTKGIEVVCQIVGRKEIDGGTVARLTTNFQQALDHFQGSKTSNRISVGCHVFQRLLFSNSGLPFRKIRSRRTL